jgi:hypothetical protein
MLALAATTTQAMAATASKSVRQFCVDRQDTDFIQDLSKNPHNHLAFRNHGGLINGGVCWWHSRFTRNALHLTIFRPELPRPSERDMASLIKDIRQGRTVVTIPGFNNLREFSSDRTAANLIQKELEAWQRMDGFVRQQWIVGLSGSRRVSAENMTRRMDTLYDYVVGDKNVAYQRLQMPGVVAHAWLVVDMDKTRDGYKLHVHDSNYFGIQEWTFREGMTHFNYGGFGEFTPYLERQRELRNIQNVASRFCR